MMKNVFDSCFRLSCSIHFRTEEINKPKNLEMKTVLFKYSEIGRKQDIRNLEIQNNTFK